MCASLPSLCLTPLLFMCACHLYLCLTPLLFMCASHLYLCLTPLLFMMHTWLVNDIWACAPCVAWREIICRVLALTEGCPWLCLLLDIKLLLNLTYWRHLQDVDRLTPTSKFQLWKLRVIPTLTAKATKLGITDPCELLPTVLDDKLCTAYAQWLPAHKSPSLDDAVLFLENWLVSNQSV